MLQQRRHDVPSGRHDETDHDPRLHERQQHRTQRAAGRCRQNRRNQHHGDHGKVLENQDRHGRVAVIGIAVASLR